MSDPIKCGPYVLTDVVAEAAYGTFYRAVETEGFEFQRHHLVMVPNAKVRGAGFDRVSDSLHGWVAAFGGIRGVLTPSLLTDFDGSKKLSCAFDQGRSLRAIMEAHRDDPCLGVEHVLTVAHGLAVAIAAMQRAGVAHGAMTPDGVWLTTKGLIRVVDAPLGQMFADMGITRDVFGSMADAKQCFAVDFANDQESCGLILYQMVTGGLPHAGGFREDTPFGMPQWDGEIAEVPELRHFVATCLQAGYASVDDFLQDAMAAFNTPDHSPSTFNCAFLMQSVFREPISMENEAMVVEKSFEYLKILVQTLQAVQTASDIDSDRKHRRRQKRWPLIALVAGVLVGGCAMGTYAFFNTKRATVQAFQTQEEHARLKHDMLTLMEEYGAAGDRFKRDLMVLALKLAAASKPVEKENLQRQIDERQKTFDAQQAGIQKQLAAIQARARSLSGSEVMGKVDVH